MTDRKIALGVVGLLAIVSAATLIVAGESPVESENAKLSQLPRCKTQATATPGSAPEDVVSRLVTTDSLDELPPWAAAALDKVPFGPTAKCYLLSAGFDRTNGELVLADVEVHGPAHEARLRSVNPWPEGQDGWVVNASIGAIQPGNTERLLTLIPQEVVEVAAHTYQAVDYNHDLSQLVYSIVPAGSREWLLTVEAPPGQARGIVERMKATLR